ncbi:peptide chain release factor N(5)-glutamine methyltransferase [Psychrobacter sp. AOP22-C1-22]|uniref:peptide chain release factor N(5)-glutamine methyltransferase n=1 Tax=unclassified Psychrobacter TaxID=196806 RepID=UPI001787DF68|nr:peptide chain release factor N(5)-glutamine methyltransferase [Psychrobacter sp. FME6]MBE0406145.1 peptide chain release factor N(5)-glutamine methyltransferase [Psychrobacter sp. FME6]MDN5897841.1 peptide chain release factor N(5)-glutamine methyltransferase [Psychrobacter sp.]
MATIQQIKQQAVQTATKLAVPPFWITDWLLYVIDKPTLFLITDENYQLNASESEQFNAGVTKMQQGIPLAYLTGEQEFWSLTFKVNEHTLIPRPDTEVLVETVLEWINEQPAEQSDGIENKRLLDLGTGSGCIAISLAHELKLTCELKKARWKIVAVDFSLEALKVARDNALQNNIDTIEFIQSSWYQELPIAADKLFDVIVSNPPYIDESDTHLAHLKAEPISALSAANHGLADIEHIAQQAPKYLRVGGLLAVEHGFDQGLAVRQLFADNKFSDIKTIKDFGGNDRITLGQL